MPESGEMTIREARELMAAAYLVYICAPWANDVEDHYKTEYEQYMNEVNLLGKSAGHIGHPERLYDTAILVRCYTGEMCEHPNIAPIWNRANALTPPRSRYDFEF
jgi:hypothetical protein